MKLIRKILHIFTFICVLGVFLLSTTFFWPEPFYWLATLITLAPLYFLALPLIVLVVLSLLTRDLKALLILLISSLFFVVFVLGFNVPLDRFLLKAQKSGDVLRVMTLNIGQGVEEKRLARFISDIKPDIVVFQDLNYHSQFMLRRMAALKGFYIHIDNDLGIASHFPAFEFDVHARRAKGNRGNLYNRYKVDHPAGSFILLNVHVDSPRYAIVDILKRKWAGVKGMKEKSNRMKQEAEIISQINEDVRLPVMIAGDFNLRVNHPVYHRYFNNWQNAFASTCWGFGHTLFTKWHGLRLDHVLFDDNWEVLDSFVGSDLGGEHRAVVVDLNYAPKMIKKEETSNSTDGLPAKLFPLADSVDALLMLNFQNTAEGFVNIGQTELSVDAKNTYKFGNSLRMQIGPTDKTANMVYAFKPWYLLQYPELYFSYNVPKGVPLEVQVQTSFGDWITVAYSPVVKRNAVFSPEAVVLTDDGQWHEMKLNAREVIRARLASIDQIKTMRFVISANRHLKDTVWIDDFRILRTAPVK